MQQAKVKYDYLNEPDGNFGQINTYSNAITQIM